MDSIRHHIGKSGVHTKYPKFLSDEECDHICNVIDKYEEKVLALKNPNTDSAYHGQLTGQFHIHNWMSMPEIKEMELHKRLWQLEEFQSFPQLVIQCWCNTLRKDEGLILHRHDGPAPEHRDDLMEVYHRRPPVFYSCNIFLKGTHNKTWFQGLGDIEHSRGDLMVFDSHLIHEVDKNPYDETRYSMALDIYHQLLRLECKNKIIYTKS